MQEIPLERGGGVVRVASGEPRLYRLPRSGYASARGRLVVHGEAPARVFIVNQSDTCVEFYLMPEEPAEFTMPSPGGVFGFNVVPSDADATVELLEMELIPDGNPRQDG
ncbi:MAG: hypothetical protein PHI35_00300 [Victivallaceae bacterium]|nr:hypothetical protein [Victivallaceae bacterium]